MPVFEDQIGNRIELEHLPRKIISTVPSQTELLSYLGLEKELAGITKFCIYPEHIFRSKTRVGGTKTLNLEKIESIEPDLILANKEENTRPQILALQRKYLVWVSDINTLEDATAMIRSVGSMTGVAERAEILASKIESGFQKLAAETRGYESLRTLYLIWKDPYMFAGVPTFIDEMLKSLNLSNVISQPNQRFTERYPALTIEQIKELKPELILLSSEPYPFKDQHVNTFKELLPAAEVQCVDGTYFSWYGSRLLPAMDYFRNFRLRLIENFRSGDNPG